ncbi:MAG TPA: alpha/beta hydrolase [Dehalococcoidia bacterium]
MATAQDGFVTVGGVRLHYRDWGGDGPAVLLLHGLMADAGVWDAVAARLADRFRPIALDQRGHGLSDRPASGYAPRDYAADAAGLVRALGLRRVHVVGHSMGGRTAMALAALYPRLVGRLVIVDIGPEAWVQNYQETVRAVTRTPASFPDEEALRRWLPERAQHRAPELAAGMDRGPDGALRWRWDRAAVLETVRIGRTRGWWHYLRDTRAPALVVRGEQSRELRPDVARRMAAVLDGRGAARRGNGRARLAVIHGCGHDVPRQAPAALAALLSLFLGPARAGRRAAPAGAP